MKKSSAEVMKMLVIFTFIALGGALHGAGVVGVWGMAFVMMAPHIGFFLWGKWSARKKALPL